MLDLLQSVNLHWTLLPCKVPGFHCVHSWYIVSGLRKQAVTWTCYPGITENHFFALAFLCASQIIPVTFLTDRSCSASFLEDFCIIAITLYVDFSDWLLSLNSTQLSLFFFHDLVADVLILNSTFIVYVNSYFIYLCH